MKRKETTPGGSVEEYAMREWSTNEDRPTKRHDIEDMVSSGDTSVVTQLKFLQYLEIKFRFIS